MTESVQSQEPHWRNSPVINSEWINKDVFTVSHLTKNTSLIYGPKTRAEFQGPSVSSLSDLGLCRLFNLSEPLSSHLQNEDDSAIPVYPKGWLGGLKRRKLPLINKREEKKRVPPWYRPRASTSQ